jgi:site-specific DNA recombinase
MLRCSCSDSTGEAYVTSQASEGWTIIPTVYDDGGYSGGTIERPGLKALLTDIEAGQIDVVVVYKIDRLTRSLTDFSRIIETFDKAGASWTP